MGNTPSSQSVRSKTSQNSLINSFRNDRRSKAMSFYATPPGSLDLEEGPFPSARSLPSTPTIAPDPATKTEFIESKRDDEQTARVWRPGVYTLVNAGSGAVLDLSGKDTRSVIGFSSHYGPNQQVSMSFVSHVFRRFLKVVLVDFHSAWGWLHHT